LQTNLVIQTDQARTYFVELYSFRETHMVGASWTYPREEFAEQLAQRNAAAQSAKQLTTLAATRLSDVNCEYGIKTIAGNPKWKPRPGGVCDDGMKTVIRFPYAMAGRDAPVLFLLRGGNTHMVNYRPQGQMYVIDRLIDGAELRLGQDDEAEVVRIARRSR
jgi:type IV secretion system protein VirB9